MSGPNIIIATAATNKAQKFGHTSFFFFSLRGERVPGSNCLMAWQQPCTTTWTRTEVYIVIMIYIAICIHTNGEIKRKGSLYLPA